MPIDNVLWRARVGSFNAFKFEAQGSSKFNDPLSFLKILLLFMNYIFSRLIYHTFYISVRYSINLLDIIGVEVLALLYIKILLYCCGDIELNPGPKQSSLTFCHWNLNGIAAHDFIKISLLQGYITNRNFDIICSSETFLNSTIDSEDNRLKIEGYNLIRSDDPSGSKKGGVCIYYKEHIPLIKRDDLCSLSNCLVTEIRLENEKCLLTCLYRSPSQNQQEFENFCSNFDVLMDQINNELPNCSVITGDFNARCSKWWNEDITNSIGREIDTLTLAGGYKQIINQPTHIVNNLLSCIDLIFCNNMNLISNFGVDFSIFEKCHHNIIFGKINIRIPLPPSYIREVWDSPSSKLYS